MPDHDLFLCFVGLLILIVTAIAAWREIQQQRREERSFELAYAKGRLRRDSLRRQLDDSEAAAISYQHQRHQQHLTETR